ncbi:MAG: hypothetical protein AVDCRST_MAG83-2340 [uncultured Arthrobacter sp.]|uniref:CAAX prenyl protease 2/Lysostaphin resistance protein A-like domain-containing protein n=1 Tax=uncultured Arthrobacter sp. TaxID=114050 RepID=A0A6J4IJC4_9MICC|nr:type II CAAX endopeptidase family protein [uncultured Arthrobacter sp.]CAA9254123.1 MAG: hypothetical protein AVDCRST_MAG83-2340 [uncultured Arthrobacter sp.]
MIDSSSSTGTTARVRPAIWIGLVALAFYIFLAAVVGNLLGGLAPEGDDTAEFVYSHYIPLVIGIGAGLFFIRWAGWQGIWTEQPTPTMRPRRYWLIAIPVLAAILPLSGFSNVAWADVAITTVLIIGVGTLLVGLGEELYVRGILLVGVRERHGELATLLITSISFGLAHIVGDLFTGAPLAFILFQVSAIIMAGIAYYWIRRVTGRLWVAILVHALTDGVLYLAAGAPSGGHSLHSEALTTNESVSATAQILLLVFSAVSVISVILEDRRNRQNRQNVPAPTEAQTP